MPAAVLFNIGQRGRHAPGFFVRPLGGKGVEHVAHCHDPALDGDVLALQPIGISRTVPFLVMGQRDLPGHPHQVRVMPGQYLRADGGMGLHDLPFLLIELAGLEQDAVGDADLADIVHRAGIQDHFARPLHQAGRPREDGRELAHADDVQAGLIVPVLRRPPQAADDLQAGVQQFGGARAHLVFQDPVLVAYLVVHEAHFQHVADTGQHLQPLEWLAEKVLGPGLQGVQTGLHVGLGGKHQHRHIGVRLDKAQLLHDLKAVQVGHVDVQQYQVEMVPGIQFRHFPRLGGAVDLAVARALEHPFQQPHVGDLIVDDQDLRPGELIVDRHVTSPRFRVVPAPGRQVGYRPGYHQGSAGSGRCGSAS